jgi:hypothetical protein
MAWLNPIEFNMNIFLDLRRKKADHPLIATIQKIAIYSLIPIALVAFFEAVVKNMIFINLFNLGIVVLNSLHDLWPPEKSPQ